MSQTIQMDEFLTALANAEIKSDDPTRGMTAREIQDTIGLGPASVKQRLRDLHKKGQLIVSRRYIVGISGTSYPVPCYRVKETGGTSAKVLRNIDRRNAKTKSFSGSRKPKRSRRRSS